MVLAICERFGQLPSAVYAEDVTLLRLLQIEALGKPEGGDQGDYGG